MAFQARWRELTREGWKSQQSTGLSYDIVYIMPGKKKRGGVRGKDYFVGEEELMKYLDRADLDELREQQRLKHGSSGEPRSSAAACELSEQGNSNSDGNHSLPNDSNRSSNEVLDANVPSTQEDGSDTHRAVPVPAPPASSSSHTGIIQVVSPHDTTFESGGICSAEDEDGASSNASSTQTRRNLNDDFADADDTQTNIQRQQSERQQDAILDEETKKDSLCLDEEPCSDVDDSNGSVEHAALDSDAEDDEGSAWNDDELSDDYDLDDGLDEDGPPQPDLLFDDSLLDSAGGVEQLASGNMSNDLLREMAKTGWHPLEKTTPYEYLMEPYEPRPASSTQDDYPRLYDGPYGPTVGALRAAGTPLGAFLYFAQPTLWDNIADASNAYFAEKIEERVEAQCNKQVARKLKHPKFQPKEREQIRLELERTADITGRDLCVFIGLLAARTISPNKEKLEHHWKTTDQGAIPRGCFGVFMVRDRFMHISRNLHFSSNGDERAQTDKAWKIRPVIDALTRRFQHGYIPPPTMAFDEAMLPSRSRFNRMRVFMKDKPHKFGTKLFMLCCSTTAYCIRFEVYLGANGALTDYKSGPAAVTRNLGEVFGVNGPGTGAMRLIVTDRFYTSVALAAQMLTMGFYTVGTVQTDRLGLPVSIVGEKKKGAKKKKPPKNRPAHIERGTFEVTEHKQIPGFRALRWWDNKAVYMLASGGSVDLDRVVRRDKRTGGQTEVACPRVLKDYQTLMGGVDVHDQLRLQRYSLQLAIKYKKYYKSLFLGLIDLAIINAYIVHNARRAADGLRKLSHVKFQKQLHLELCQLREEDWEGFIHSEEIDTTPSRVRTRTPQSRHVPVQNDEWRPGNNQAGRKRRTRVCKVCSLLKGTDDARGGDSSIYCSDCKLANPSKKPKAWRVFLCGKARHKHNGALMTCFDIWHRAWRDGTLLPKKARKRNIRARTPAQMALSESDEEVCASSDDESMGAGSKRARASAPEE